MEGGFAVGVVEEEDEKEKHLSIYFSATPDKRHLLFPMQHPPSSIDLFQ
jgi:hypothetical protein